MCWWSSRRRVGSIAICATPCRAIRASSSRACCSIRDSTRSGGGNKDYIKEFPGTLDELSKFDVVFLGDVGLDDNQLTAEDCRLLRGLVEFQASGLVFLPGMPGPRVLAAGNAAGRPLSSAARRHAAGRLGLADAEPLRTDRARASGACSRSSPTRKTKTSRSGRTCPASNGTRRSSAPRPAAKCSASTATRPSDYGRLPLLVTRTFGAGKVLFMGTDGAWRWRKGVEDKYHYRFWGQVVRWMAYQRNMAKGETMRLYYSPDQPQLGKTVVLKANVMEPSGEPLSKGDVTARDRGPLGPGANDALHVARRRMGRVHGPVRFRRAGPASSDALLPRDRRHARRLVLRAGGGEGAGRPTRAARKCSKKSPASRAGR